MSRRPTPSEVVGNIRSHRWRQGRVVPRSWHRSSARELEPLKEKSRKANPRKKEDLLAVVITHSCDLVHPDLKEEPFAELLVGTRVDVPDGNFLNARSPRTLHLPVRVDGHVHHYEFRAWKRIRISRKRLASAPPDPNRSLDEPSLDVLRAWLTLRHDRPAFPDEFVNRLGPQRARIRRAVKRLNDVSHLLVALNPWGENEPGESYGLTTVFVLDDDVFRDPGRRERAQKDVDRLTALLAQCQGIDLDPDSRTVMAQSELSMRDYLQLWPWTEFNYTDHESPKDGG